MAASGFGPTEPVFREAGESADLRERRGCCHRRDSGWRALPQRFRCHGACNLIVSYLPDPERHPLWDGIKRLLEPATFGETGVRDDNELVWIAFDGPLIFAAGTTYYADGEAQIRLCAGYRHKEWVEQAEALVSAWARDCGATKLTMRGRKGWARYFRAFGWVVSGHEDGKHLYEKAL